MKIILETSIRPETYYQENNEGLHQLGKWIQFAWKFLNIILCPGVDGGLFSVKTLMPMVLSSVMKMALLQSITYNKFLISSQFKTRKWNVSNCHSISHTVPSKFLITVCGWWWRKVCCENIVTGKISLLSVQRMNDFFSFCRYQRMRNWSMQEQRELYKFSQWL